MTDVRPLAAHEVPGAPADAHPDVDLSVSLGRARFANLSLIHI